jgi:hypothetical protein
MILSYIMKNAMEQIEWFKFILEKQEIFELRENNLEKEEDYI